MIGLNVNNAITQLDAALSPHGFRLLRQGRSHLCSALWKLQTININRAVALIEVSALPSDLRPLLRTVRKEAAFRCGFFPLLYGLGTQVVLHVTGSRPQEVELRCNVDKIDNGWSIIQSIFVIHADVGLVSSARTWGQYITGKYQDAIAATFQEPHASE